MVTGAVEAQPLKVGRIDVTPTPFALGDVTLSCVLKKVGSECSVADSTSDGPDTHLRPRYAFRISDDVTPGSWSSGWLRAPALCPRQKATVSFRASYQPDTRATSSITRVTVAVVLQDGRDGRKPKRCTYYRWSDGLFHADLEPLPAPSADAFGVAPVKRAPLWESIGLPPLPTSWYASVDSIPVMPGGETTIPDPSAPPERSPTAEEKPRQRLTWGQLKVRYR